MSRSSPSPARGRGWGEDAWARTIVLLTAALLLSSATQAATIDRIRAQGVLHCGAVERPGIAEAPPEGGAKGIAVDICRAVAVAVLGPKGRVSFSLYESPASFDPVRRGTDELAFLTGGEIAAQSLMVQPGPTAAILPTAVMVPDASPVAHLSGLSGQTICMMTGGPGQRALEAASGPLNLTVARLPFQEDVEMLDAYNAGHCGAAVAEATYLADMRQSPGIKRITSRLLPETLAADPLIAVTPEADGRWAAAVAWVMTALLLADQPPGPWQAPPATSLPARHVAGLRPAWQTDVQTAVGGYASIVRRNLTEPLGLAAGPNALWPAGLLLPPAVR